MNNVNGPTTNKRSIESNVLVDDGNIIVLGGLLQDEYSGNQREGAAGWATSRCSATCSRTRRARRKKTNLMVFLRPVVVRDDDAERRAVARPLRRCMRSQQNRRSQPGQRMLDSVPIGGAAAADRRQRHGEPSRRIEGTRLCRRRLPTAATPAAEVR